MTNDERLHNMKKLINFTDDRIVKRLRWIMVGTMLFSMLNTLAGQPESFWHTPETAIRGDGLSIHNATNHTFDFFLGHGWQVYLLACLVYFSVAFFVVSILPRTGALIAIFSFIFGHCYGATNWLAVRWHMGMASPTIYGIVLGVILTFLAFAKANPRGPAIKRLRWIGVCVILLDCINTLVGQPRSYWQHPETVHEANSLSFFFLSRGYIYYCIYDLIYSGVVFLLASILPEMIALVSIFSFIFGHFVGASNWFFYEWRMGMEAPVIYGIVLSIAIVLLAFPRTQSRNKTLKNVPERTTITT